MIKVDTKTRENALVYFLEEEEKHQDAEEADLKDLVTEDIVDRNRACIFEQALRAQKGEAHEKQSGFYTGENTFAAASFCVRVPVSFFMSRIRPVSLFRVGLATPCSTVIQILLCFGCMAYVKRKRMIEI